MRRSWTWPGFMLCFVAGMTMMWGYDQSSTGQTWLGPTPELYPSGDWSDSDATVPVSAADPTWGTRAAPVTVVEFSDLTCGHCLELEATLAQLRARYGPAQVRVVWKHLPHPKNPEAARVHSAAEAVFRAAGPKAFWDFHGSLVRVALSPDGTNRRPSTETPPQQPAPSGDALDQLLETLAIEAGANPARYRAERSSPAVAEKIRQDGRLGRALGVRGTPTCFVNGIALSGGQPADAFGAAVDRQLAASRALRVRGTRADRIYVALTNANRQPGALDSGGRPMALLEEP